MYFKQLYRYVFLFLLSLLIFMGCETSGSKSEPSPIPTIISTPSPTLTPSPIPTTTLIPSPIPTLIPSPLPTVTPTPIVIHKVKGYLIDSPIKGVTYICAEGMKGITDSNGTFECEKAPIVFKIGGLKIGTLTEFRADNKVYPQDLLGLDRDNYTNFKLKLLARLLQSLDDDGDIDDRITITQSLRDDIDTIHDFNNMSIGNVSDLVLGLGKSLVSECGALKHLGDKSVSCNSDGSYYVYSVPTRRIPPISKVYAYAKLGNLANANVKIYLIKSDGSRELKWSEVTSSGTILEEIGKFNTHSSELDSSSFYLYEVSGGEDWDYNDDAVLDTTSTPNLGKLRSFVKGEVIKEIGERFVVNAFSEILYEKVVVSLNNSFNLTSFEQFLNQESKTILKKDIDGDGDITYQDLLLYEPTVHKEYLVEFYQIKHDKVISSIHNKQIPLLNLSNLLGSYDTGESTYQVLLSKDGTKAFVANFYNGLMVLDVSDSSNITFLGRYDTNDRVWSVQLSEDESKVFIADSYNGLIVLDITDFSNITKLGSYSSNLFAVDVKISADITRAFVIDEVTGLQVLDITDFNNITLLSSYNTRGNAKSVTLSSDETRAFIADGHRGVTILDVSHSDNISFLGSYDNNGFSRKIFLSLDEKKAFVGKDNGVDILDVSDFSNITLLDTYSTTEPIWKVLFSKDESKVFLANEDNGLVILDISTENNIISLGSFNVHERVYDVALSSDESKAFITVGYDGFKLLDISSPENITEISSYTEDESIAFFSLKISKDGTKAFIMDIYDNLIILNISDPYHITKLASIDIEGGLFFILSTDESKVFIAEGRKGLQVYDISDLTHIIKGGRFDISGINIQGVTLSKDGNRLFVTTQNSGVMILEIGLLF